MNFACSSRARGIDISQVLVFATDMETYDLAHSLGMRSFFDEKVCPLLCMPLPPSPRVVEFNSLQKMFGRFTKELWSFAEESCGKVCRSHLYSNDDGQGTFTILQLGYIS